jgi:hypothetical protein
VRTPCRLGAEGGRRLTTAPQDHQPDQAGLADQREGVFVPRLADDLDHLRVDARLLERRGDDVLVQGEGRADGGGPGAQHTGVAGFEQLRGNVDGYVRPGFVVDADDPDRPAPLDQPQAARQLTYRNLPHHRLGVGKQAQVGREVVEAVLAQPQPIEQGRAHAGVLGRCDVVLVGCREFVAGFGQPAGHGGQGGRDLVVGGLGQGVGRLLRAPGESGHQFIGVHGLAA